MIGAPSGWGARHIPGYSGNVGEYHAIGTFSVPIEVTQGDEFKACALSTRREFNNLYFGAPHRIMHVLQPSTVDLQKTAWGTRVRPSQLSVLVVREEDEAPYVTMFPWVGAHWPSQRRVSNPRIYRAWS